MAIKSKTIRVPVEPSVHRQIKHLAENEDLSLATIVRRAISAYLAGLEQSSKEQVAS